MRLQRFKETKLNNKHIIISFGIILLLLAIYGIYKAFAVYKIEKNYDVLRSKIGDFSKDDIAISYTLMGQEMDMAFPKKEDGYVYDSVTCKDGVTASWDTTNWGLININSNGQDKIKCTVNFNGLVKNYDQPQQYTFTPPVSGTYKLEVWGAQAGNVSGMTNYDGALGGYATGKINLEKGYNNLHGCWWSRHFTFKWKCCFCIRNRF